jgi:hypothetical protein
MRSGMPVKTIVAVALACGAGLTASAAMRTVIIKIEPSMVTRESSIALKHLTLEGMSLDAPVIEVALSCAVLRESGSLDCARAHREAAGNEFVVAAIRRSRAMRLDPAKLDGGEGASLRTNLTVALAGSERRTIDFLAAPRLKMTDVQWAEKPSRAEIESVYPQDLLREGVTASVNLVCQIQSDRSLLCATADPEPVGNANARDAYQKFSWAGRAIMTLYTAAPKLESGASSSGAVVATRIDFKPND